MDIVLKIEGMSCGGCAASVEKALRAGGADNVKVDLASGKASFSAPAGANAESFRAAVDDAGYEAAIESRPAA